MNTKSLLVSVGLTCTASCLSIPAYADSQWVVTPRFWYAYSDRSAFEFFDTESGAGGSATLVPLYGATLSFIPERTEGAAYSLTLLNGYKSEPYGDFLLTGFQSTTRSDIEFVAQFPLGKHGALWTIGARFVDQSVESRGLDQFNDPFVIADNFKLYLAEFGFSASSIFGSQDSHRLFGVLNLMAGYEENQHRYEVGAPFYGSFGAFVAGGDVSGGYSYMIDDSISFSSRYRIFILSGPDANFHRQTGFVHGPEIGFSWRFD
jgi:hypothetical protein